MEEPMTSNANEMQIRREVEQGLAVREKHGSQEFKYPEFDIFKDGSPVRPLKGSYLEQVAQ